MTPSRAEMLVACLREMQAAAPEIEASAVVSVYDMIFLEMYRAAQDLEQVFG